MARLPLQILMTSARVLGDLHASVRAFRVRWGDMILSRRFMLDRDPPSSSCSLPERSRRFVVFLVRRQRSPLGRIGIGGKPSKQRP